VQVAAKINNVFGSKAYGCANLLGDPRMGETVANLSDGIESVPYVLGY
jgi:hypothetical protein